MTVATPQTPQEAMQYQPIMSTWNDVALLKELPLPSVSVPLHLVADTKLPDTLQDASSFGFLEEDSVPLGIWKKLLTESIPEDNIHFNQPHILTNACSLPRHYKEISEISKTLVTQSMQAHTPARLASSIPSPLSKKGSLGAQSPHTSNRTPSKTNLVTPDLITPVDSLRINRLQELGKAPQSHHTPNAQSKEVIGFRTPSSAQVGLERFERVLEGIIQAHKSSNLGASISSASNLMSSPCAKSAPLQKALLLEKGQKGLTKLSTGSIVQLQSSLSRMNADSTFPYNYTVSERQLMELLVLCDNTLQDVECEILTARNWNSRRGRHLVSSDADSDSESEEREQAIGGIGDASLGRSFCINLDLMITGLDAADIALNVSQSRHTLTNKSVYQQFLETVIAALHKIGEDLLFIRTSIHSYAAYREFIVDKSLTHKILMLAARFNNLLERLTTITDTHTSLSDDALIIKQIYLCIHPLTIASATEDSNPLLSKSIVEGIQKNCVRMLEVIFSKYIAQQTFILREVLFRIDKSIPSFLAELSGSRLAQYIGGYRIRDSRAISIASAIFLHLWQAHFSLSNAYITVANNSTDDIPLDAYRSNVYSMQREVSESITTVLRYLLEGAFQAKSKNTETAFALKHILSNLVHDMLSLLDNQSYPIVHTALFILTNILYEHLVASNTDPGYRSAILEYLGDIASITKKYAIDVSEISSLKEWKTIEIGMNIPVEVLERVINYQKSLIQQFIDHKIYDTVFHKCNLLTLIGGWNRHLFPLFNPASRKLYSANVVDVADDATRLYERWSRQISGDSQMLTSEMGPIDPVDCMVAYKELSVHSPLYATSGKTLVYLFETLQDSKQIAIMTKAIRELRKIINVDPATLGQEQFRDFIQNLVENDSPSVRDTAIDFLGSYMISEKIFVDIYYPLVRSRLYDPSLAVRKRIVKLLKDIYLVSGIGQDLQKEIASELIMCSVRDSDTSIRDLCVKLIVDIWFTHTEQIAPDARFEELEQKIQRILKDRMDIIRGISNFGINSEILSQLLIKVNQCSILGKFKSATIFMTVYTDIAMDSLLNEEGTDESLKLLALHPFSIALPSGTAFYLDSLLNFIKSPADYSNECEREKAIKLTYLVLPIVTATLPFATDPDPARLIATSNKLYNIIHSTGVTIVNLAVQCLVVIIRKLDSNHEILVNLLQRHLTILQQWKVKLDGETLQSDGLLPSAAERSFQLSVLRPLYVVGCLGHHFDFDRYIETHPSETRVKWPTKQHLFTVLSYYCITDGLGQKAISTAIEALCMLILSMPMMLMASQSMTILKRIFEHACRDNYAQGDLKNVTQILQFLFEFCKKESELLMVAKNKRNKQSLFGEKHEQEMTAASSVIQNHLDHILPMILLDRHAATQKAALNLVVLALEEGMVHPTTCSPYTIASVVSRNSEIAEIGLKTFQSLYTKHLSLVKGKIADGVSLACVLLYRSYGSARGVTNTSNGNLAFNMQSVYALVRTNRARRKEFLRTLVQSLIQETRMNNCSGANIDHVVYSRFVCETIYELDFKTREEVMVVLMELEHLWINYGSEVVQTLEDKNDSSPSSISSALVHSMIIALQRILQQSYRISEQNLQQINGHKKDRSIEKPVTRYSTTPINWIPACLNMERLEYMKAGDDERRAWISEIIASGRRKSELVESHDVKGMHTSSCEDSTMEEDADASSGAEYNKPPIKAKKKIKR